MLNMKMCNKERLTCGFSLAWCIRGTVRRMEKRRTAAAFAPMVWYWASCTHHRLMILRMP